MMQNPAGQPNQEFDAIQQIYKALDPLSEEARQRVVNYIVSLFKLDSIVLEPEEFAAQEESSPPAKRGSIGAYESFADLYDAASPVTNAEKALVAGYWIQDCLGNDSFSSQSVNTELKHLGYGVANITAALEALKDMKPAQIHQLRKSGASQQARKTYKVTVAGSRTVQSMIEKSTSAG